MSTWILYLNDMRHAKSENMTAVCRAATRADLEALLEREHVPTYKSNGFGPYGQTVWCKNFREGGPLEWFNPPLDQERTFDEVDVEALVTAHRARLERTLASIPLMAVDVDGSEVGPRLLETRA